MHVIVLCCTSNPALCCVARAILPSYHLNGVAEESCLRPGGVVSMQGFLEKFAPDTLSKPRTTPGDLYCSYNDQRIQWFTSSLFLAGALTEVSGRRVRCLPVLCHTILSFSLQSSPVQQEVHILGNTKPYMLCLIAARGQPRHGQEVHHGCSRGYV